MVDTTAPVVASVVARIGTGAGPTMKPAGNVTFRPGDTIVLTITADAPGCSVTTGWSVVDDQFDVGDNTVRDVGGGTYVDTYPTSPQDLRHDGVYAIPVTVTDTAGNAATFYVDVVLDSSPPSPSRSRGRRAARSSARRSGRWGSPSRTRSRSTASSS